MSHANVSDSAFLLYIHEKSGGPGYLKSPDVPDTYFCLCLFIPIILLELSKGINFDSFYPSIFHQKQAGRQHATGEKKKEPRNRNEQASASALSVPLTSLRLGSHAASGGPSSSPEKGQSDTNLSGWLRHPVECTMELMVPTPESGPYLRCLHNSRLREGAQQTPVHFSSLS